MVKQKIKEMALEQFLNILSKHKVKWYLYGPYESILTVINHRQFSPLTFVCKVKANKIFKLWQYRQAAEALHLPEQLMKEIEDSSDLAFPSCFNKETRQKLLKATKPSGKIPKSTLEIMETP